MRRPTACSGARLAPARMARAAAPGILIGTISRCLPKARKYMRSNSAISYTFGPAKSGTSPAGGPSASSAKWAATSSVATGWNRMPAGTGITGSFAIACTTNKMNPSWNWVARRIVQGRPESVKICSDSIFKAK